MWCVWPRLRPHGDCSYFCARPPASAETPGQPGLTQCTAGGGASTCRPPHQNLLSRLRSCPLQGGEDPVPYPSVYREENPTLGNLAPFYLYTRRAPQQGEALRAPAAPQPQLSLVRAPGAVGCGQMQPDPPLGAGAAAPHLGLGAGSWIL
ncbi:hypothetical protein CB1_001428017 [Camelus ferus]|nr:hypothetical protein CB1_001428017 [Camelus ferus]